MADDPRARVVAQQQMLARQQRRVEVRGDEKRGRPQMVDDVRNVMQPTVLFLLQLRCLALAR